MRKLILPFLIVAFIFSFKQVSAQANVRDSSIKMPLIYASYGFHMLGGDIADMFGPSSTIGAGFGFKTKSNIYIGAEYSYLFGGKAQMGDEIIAMILTHDGQIIGQGGEYATFQYYERGHIFWLQVGKIFPVFNSNPNSGFMLKGGVGFVQHRMDVAVQENTALQLSGDYKYGYDRLTRGIGLNEFIGYMFIGNSRVWNFYAGLDFSQAWTKNVRDINFDTRQNDGSQHLDLFYGFKIGWVIPVYRSAPADYYYY